MLKKYRILIGALAAMIVSGVAVAYIPPADAQIRVQIGEGRRYHRRYRHRHRVREVYWRHGRRYTRWVWRNDWR